MESHRHREKVKQSIGFWQAEIAIKERKIVIFFSFSIEIVTF